MVIIMRYVFNTRKMNSDQISNCFYSRCESIRGSGSSFIHTQSRHCVRVRGQPHVLAALPSNEELLVPTE